MGGGDFCPLLPRLKKEQKNLENKPRFELFSLFLLISYFRGKKMENIYTKNCLFPLYLPIFPLFPYLQPFSGYTMYVFILDVYSEHTFEKGKSDM